MESIITLKRSSLSELRNAMDENLRKNKKTKFIVEVNTISFSDLMQLKEYPIIDIAEHLAIAKKASIGLNFSSIKKVHHSLKNEVVSVQKERVLSVVHFIIFISCISYLLYRW